MKNRNENDEICESNQNTLKNLESKTPVKHGKINDENLDINYTNAKSGLTVTTNKKNLNKKNNQNIVEIDEDSKKDYLFNGITK